MNINLHIERLVLEGVDLPRHQRPLLQAAVEGELARLLAEGGLVTGNMHVRSVQAGGVELGDGRDPVEMGAQIAGAVYGGMGK
ncbi:MAG TPA: hypothetical protein PLE99_10110 [Candidatus Thiothrix moscowensis]|uniref:hypothetical protein n=1 Tax=Thiothrix sp. UBA2016 TaxID=1947695 RepID=UPI0025F17B38|nr:hypothetical protein [Thiothrix sp. UBA2016]HRJ53113.1 hypothetical protein [Candidatus Thiothrix moscowensis]HRJ93104.1 hypothetical protein [Candidatus Thiothrix moscowensis]